MRLLRASVLALLVLGAASWLLADTFPDPIIKLTVPARGTFTLCDVSGAVESCTITLVNGEPDTTIGADGFGSFAVLNPDPTLTIDDINFRFQTDNLFQPFSAFTNNFTDVTLTRNFNEGCITSDDVCVLPNPEGTLDVNYFGIAKPADPGSASLDAISCDFEGCPTAVGFVPFSNVVVTVHYVPTTLDPDCCVGIQPRVEAGVSLSADVPEPGSFVLLFGAAGLLAIKRKLWRR